LTEIIDDTETPRKWRDGGAIRTRSRHGAQAGCVEAAARCGRNSRPILTETAAKAPRADIAN